MTTVGIREAKAKLSHYVDLARDGDHVVITDRGRPVARLVAIADDTASSAEVVLAELAESGVLELGIAPEGAGSSVRRSAPVALTKEVSASEVVRRMRR